LLALLIWQTTFGIHGELVGRLFAWVQQGFIVLAAMLLSALAAHALSVVRSGPTRTAEGLD
jgi:hypothetical protein